jgi:hypothetical protein
MVRSPKSDFNADSRLGAGQSSVTPPAFLKSRSDANRLRSQRTLG